MFNYLALCWDQTINAFLLNIVLILTIILLGGVIPLFERKFLSLTQSRVGPNFVGYNGRLQFVADALKVLINDIFIIYRVNSFLFFFLPVFYLSVNLVFFVNVYWASYTSYSNIEYNLVFFSILEAFTHILILVVGVSLKNRYTWLASSRVVNILFTTELALLLLFSFYLYILQSFTLSRIFLMNNYVVLIFMLLPAAPLLVLFFLLETANTPFDLVEAETEIIMGYHVEYSGFLFALFVLAEYLHLVAALYITCVLYF